ncbi:DUF6086 family protein [Nocardia sp. GCM10030253]|uniref:DUF6086 family protein n=1 Tax=Nocardia sp. GCM10030253 TaxID=3273404 RepID=UPI003634F059
MEADACEITPGVLEGFIATVLAWRGRTSHAVLQALSDGFIATMLVIAERAGIEVPWEAQVGRGVDGVHDVQVVSSPLSSFGSEVG